MHNSGAIRTVGMQTHVDGAASLPATNAKRLRKGANRSRECAVR
jgi:hypothetical protein